MAKVNLSEMSVEALMDLRKRVDEMLLGPSFKSSWRGLPLLAAEGLFEEEEAH